MIASMRMIFSMGLSMGIAFYFNSFSLKRAVADASAETESTASEFHDTWRYIIRRFISLSVSDELRENISGLLSEQGSLYAEYNNALQDDFSSFIEIHELISSVLLVKTDGTAFRFYPYSFRLTDAALCDPAVFSGMDGITLLASSPSPFSGQSEVIPIAIPLKYDSSSNLLLISSCPDDTMLLLYIFLDTDAVGTFLSTYCADASEGILYLTGPDGEALSLKQSSTDSADIQKNEIASAVSSLIAESTSYTCVNDCHVFCFPILEDQLWLVNAVPESQFMQQYSYIRSILLTIGLTSLFFIAILSVMLSFFITRPLKKLMSALRSIEDGNYRGKMQITSNDEMEQLSSSIDSMYRTIQEQFKRIKRGAE